MKKQNGSRNRLIVVALASLALVGSASAFAAPSDGPQAPTRVDPRWLPWVGCWEMTADTINSQNVESVGTQNVCVIPRTDSDGVRLITFLDGRTVFEETVVADGSRRRHVEDGCDGRQTAQWSADGYRLFTQGEITCDDGFSQVSSGVSLLVSGDTWLDIESIFLDDRKHRELIVQRYRRINDTKARELGATALTDRQLMLSARERAVAAMPLDIEDLLEAMDFVPVEAIEALAVETKAAFPIDSNALNALADSGLPTTVIDLLVAQSYPDYFVVENTAVGGVAPRPVGPRVVYQPPFYTSVYLGFPSFYYPWGWGWGSWGWGWRGYYPFGWRGGWHGGWGRYPYYGWRGRAVPSYGSRYGGRVISGQGYARARPVATPYGGGGGSRSAVRRGGGGSGGGSSGGGGSAISSGSRSSGARSGATAQPRGGSSRGSSVSSKGFTRSGGGSKVSGGKPGGSGGKPGGGAKPGGTAKPKGGKPGGGSTTP